MVQIPDEKVWEGVWETGKALVSGAFLYGLNTFRSWFKTTDKRIGALEKKIEELERKRRDDD